MRKIGRLIYTVVIGVMVASCADKGPQELQTLTVDIDNCEKLEIDTTKFIRLEANEQSLLANIYHVEVVDGKFLIQSSDMLKCFDETGRFITEISGKGQGPEEFASLQQFWMEGDTICLFDNKQRKILKYGLDGTYYSSFMPAADAELGRLPNFILDTPSGEGYYTINGWTDHTAEENPMFSVYDKNWNYKGDIPGRELESGEFANDRYSVDREHGLVYFWDALRDTLFTVDESGVTPRYAFDLGKYRLPDEIMSSPSLFERYFRFAKEGKEVPWISMASFYKAIGDKVIFSMVSGRSEKYLCVLDTKKNEVRVYSPDIDSEKYLVYASLGADNKYVYMNFVDKDDSEANPYLYKIEIDRL